jgi:2-polyprenyl-3-methyl-5-hydroxy-6-metoxy-1,4-benzoquinol methylase
VTHKKEDLRFATLDYEGFRRLAKEPGLTPNERIGFPDSYRSGKEEAIWADIVRKVPVLEQQRGLKLLDIGPGCATLPRLLAESARRHGHSVVFVDSPEMLEQLSDLPEVNKVAGFFPRDLAPFIDASRNRFDVIVSYSVLHYVFVETSVFDFVDACLQLLAPGGWLMLGDLPNVSMRNRFFASATGKAFHKAFMQTEEDPVVQFNVIERGTLDDTVVLALVMRCRAAGFDAWVVPQDPDLPMANRREDLLIHRP